MSMSNEILSGILEFSSRTLYQKREVIALFIANSHKIKV